MRNLVLLFIGLSWFGCRVQPVEPETTFELRGLHADLPCEACHDPAFPIGDLPTECAACHLEDAPPLHFQAPCETCHDEMGWPTPYDHDFLPLEDAHALACTTCHTNGGLQGLSAACASCHEAERPGPDHFASQDCAGCHVPTSWDNAVDHSFFPLDQGHALQCQSCHTAIPDFTGLTPSCTSCHAPDRPAPTHYTAFECSDCHQRTTWNQLPPHGFFPLAGNHAQTCDTCHTTIPDFTALDSTCAQCHETDRPNASHFPGQDCSSCHTPATWSTGVDHTFFPLDLGHAIDCASCHTAIPDFTGLDQACVSCHAPDRPVPTHYTAFNCDDCHQRSAWTALPDHSFFALTGNHAQTCDSCHTAIPDFTGLTGSCMQCHEADRPSPTHFAGQNCADCHTVDNWDAEVDHSFFPLDLGHAVSCESCHTAIPDFTGLDQACASCHAPDRPEPTHYTGFDCDACHERTAWSVLPNHDFFALTGNHAQTCDSCHTAIPDFTGLTGSCIQCHDADRPDPGHFTGQNCANCHTAISWSTGVDHSFFPLDLGHSVACESCHTAIPLYTGLSQACVSCHAPDRPAPSHYTGFNCDACHQRSAWSVLPDHSFFALTGNHAVTCDSCHTTIPNFTGLNGSCIQCHDGDRPTPTHFTGQDCSVCHTVDAWDTAVDHSFFPLDLGHAVACESCHTAIPDYTGLSQACVSCHAPDRPTPSHYTAYACNDCHQRSAWSVLPDHSFFALAGSHAVNCDSCHTTIPDFIGLNPACSACHEGDRPSPTHYTGQDCAGCHTPTAWGDAANHDFFPLNGNHDIACVQCHTAAPDYTGLDMECSTCHEPDRPGCHFTAQVCADCHTISGTWRNNAGSFSHLLLFGLNIPHRTANLCVECHDTPNSQCDFNCLDCHNNAPNQHQDVNGFTFDSVACIACHPNAQN